MGFLLEIRNLKVNYQKKEILKGVNFFIKKREIQALLGPNGAGKSVLAQTILGNPKYKVLNGKIFFKGKNITRFSPEKRVKLGIALCWQTPPSIEGVTLETLLKEISPQGISHFGREDLLEREVNVEFSGGEKKLSELLQIFHLNPEFVIFDEIDSGLDIEMLKFVAEKMKKLHQRGTSLLVITHQGEILNFLKPNLVNVMVDGKIICSEKNYKKVLSTIKRFGYRKCERCKNKR